MDHSGIEITLDKRLNSPNFVSAKAVLGIPNLELVKIKVLHSLEALSDKSALSGLPESEKEFRIHDAVNIQLKEILVLIRGMVGSQSYLSVLDELNASVLDKYAKIMES